MKSEVGNDLFPIYGTDFIEFYVGNAKQSSLFYQHCLGFRMIAFRGPETGCRDRVSYVMEQGKIRFILTSGIRSEHPVSRHVAQHGDGVKVIALWVEDVHEAYYIAIQRGAQSAFEPIILEDDYGKVVKAGIKTYGETIHEFIERKDYTGIFLPGFELSKQQSLATPIGLEFVDHCVGNVPLGEMNKWVDFYRKVMGFDLLVTFDDKDISTKYTALMSKVVSNGNGYIKFPINEPADGLKKSQIDEYLEFYNGAGVQHIALATNNIIHTVTEMRNRGIDFLYVPEEYYDFLQSRVGEIDEEIEAIKSLNILVDRDEEGYLLQIFTKPVVDRPTIFFEIIQRKGALSFGKGNFKALFEAIEREQALRGTL
ncbi:MAG TPA: 4-hydroxyphenylpyruvate dioxygenase [Saprospiraceae bacterium]|nr:4-hydroxyphenylpyruvate dioxygenase [Saprospiraceae bacterium]